MRLLFLILILGITSVVNAQYAHCPDIPVEYSWVEAADYAKDKEVVVRCIQWLCETPWGWEPEKRSVANAFVLEWIAGTPEITITVESSWIPSVDEHPELLYSMIHGMARYALKHPEIKDMEKLKTEGYKVVASIASQSKEMSSDREIKKLIKAHEKGKLKAWMKEFSEKKK